MGTPSAAWQQPLNDGRWIQQRTNTILLFVVGMLSLCCCGYGVVALAVISIGGDRPNNTVTAPATATAPASPSLSSTTAPGAEKTNQATVTTTAARPATRYPFPPAGVHPGAFCSPEGAYGRTVKGTLMRCTRKAGEERARWRAA